ncbi:CHASE3 domain-containing protein [soil metagenome]
MIARFYKRMGLSETTVGSCLVTAVAIGFAALTLAILAAVWVIQRNQDHAYWVDHTYQVEVTLGNLRALNEQAETARRGYMLMPSLDSFLPNYRAAADAIPPVVARLESLTGDNPAQRARLRELRAQLADLFAQRELTNRLTHQGAADAAIKAFRKDTAAHQMRMTRDLMRAMEDDEHGLLALRDADQRGSARLFVIVLGIAGALLVLVALVTMVTIIRFTRDLTASRDTLRLLNDSLEDLVVERTADLTRANDEIQRFAYIVSHDLRAPLVNVMGFTAELDGATRALGELIDRAEVAAPDIVTEEARSAAREDLPEAIGFIRTSTEKMDRLINAILKLSREGRRVLAPERIDMDALIAGIRDSLQHRIDETGAEVVIESPLPVIVTDRLAIDQILSNLIENAVKYLQPGRSGRIVVRGARSGAKLTFEVEDNGRGIAVGDHERVFDLFRRSGRQDQPGEGIGLAHVRALAYRLGGIIDVRSELGVGAVFRLTLPATLDEMQDDANERA